MQELSRQKQGILRVALSPLSFMPVKYLSEDFDVGTHQRSSCCRRWRAPPLSLRSLTLPTLSHPHDIRKYGPSTSLPDCVRTRRIVTNLIVTRNPGSCDVNPSFCLYWLQCSSQISQEGSLGPRGCRAYKARADGQQQRTSPSGSCCDPQEGADLRFGNVAAPCVHGPMLAAVLRNQPHQQM